MKIGNLKYIPFRGCFVKGNTDNPRLYDFDKHDPVNFPESFIKMVNSLYMIEDPFFLRSIVPESAVEKLAVNQVAQILAVHGMIVRRDQNCISHYEAIADFVTNDNYNDGIGQNMTLCDEKTFDLLNMCFPDRDNSIVVLYLTPNGFIKYHPKDSNLSKANYVIVASHNQAVPIVLDDIHTTVPHKVMYSQSTGINFLTVFRFGIRDGIYYPIFDEKTTAIILANLSNSQCRSDGLAFPLELLSGRNALIIGLIGRYSTIKQYIQHFSLKVNVEDSFPETNPFVGLYMSGTMYRFVFLFLPNDSSPNDSQFCNVASFAYSWMKKACSRVMCLCENNAIKIHKSCTVNGFIPRKGGSEVRFLGGINTVLLRENKMLNINPEKDGAFVFNTYNDYLSWKIWNNRKYQTQVTIQSSHPDALQMDINNTIVSILNFSREGFQRIFQDSSSLSDIEMKIRQEKLSNGNIDSLVEEKADMMLHLFNQASSMTSVCLFLEQNRCRFCSEKVEDKPDINDDHWGICCPNCKLQKFIYLNETKIEQIPLTFLQEKVNQINEKEEEFNSILSSFLSLLQNPGTQPFILWFFEFWTLKCLLSRAKELENENIIDFKIMSLFNINSPTFVFSTYLSVITKSSITEGKDYVFKLLSFFKKIPVELTAEQIRIEFIQKYKTKDVPLLTKPPELTYNQFKSKCSKEYDRALNSGFIQENTLEINSFFVLPDTTLNVRAVWNHKGQRTIQNRDYYLYYTYDGTDFNPSLAYNPICSKLAVSLVSQPESLRFLNAFNVKNHSLIIITALGKSLWINLVPNGYIGSFLEKPLISFNFDENQSKSILSSYSEESKTIEIIIPQDSKLIIYTLQFSKDYKSLSVLISRPLSHLMPISSQNGFIPKFFGLSSNRSGSVSVLCSSYCYKDQEPQYAVIRYDPFTLMAFDREDKFDCFFWPIYISDSKNIFICESESSLTPSNSVVIRSPISENSIDSVFGVINWKGSPRIIKNIPNDDPIIILNDSEKMIENSSFSENDSVLLLIKSLETFGYGEIDNISQGCYCKDVFSVESVFDPSSIKVNSYFEFAKTVADYGFPENNGLIFAVAHPRPIGNDSITSLDKPPEKDDQRRSFFPFLIRLLGSPRFLVNGPLQYSSDLSIDGIKSLIQSSVVIRQRSFPPLTILREMCTKSAESPVYSRTVSVICLGNSNGSVLASSISGIPFFDIPLASVLLGTTIQPLSFNNQNKYDSYSGFNMILSKPYNTLSTSHCAVSTIHALSCSEIVILYSDQSLDFIVETLRKIKESLETEIQLFDLKFNANQIEIYIICNIINVEYEKNLLKSEILSMISSTGEDDVFTQIFLSKICLIPFSTDPRSIAQNITPQFSTEGTEVTISTSKIIKAAVTYGASLDHIKLFSFD